MTIKDGAPKFITTSCAECFVQIGHFSDEGGLVYLGLVSNHIANERAKWLGFSGRFRRAWKALRGDLDPTFEFMTARDLNDVVVELINARKEVWGAEL